MGESAETRFVDLVRVSLTAEQEDAQTLWVPVAEEFDRNGPEAANQYLAAERQRLVERVNRLLDSLEESIDG